MTSPLFLAAGTLLDVSPEQQVCAAAGAGFDGCGLRLDPTTTTPAAVSRLVRLAEREGVLLFDVEVVRLTTADPTAEQRRLVEIAADLGARWVLTVSEVGVPDDRVRGIAALADVARVNGVRLALEFMAFTAVTDLASALAVCVAVGGGPTGVVVDALHLFRTGGTAADVAAMPTGTLAYLQLCDAPARAPSDSAGLADEARHRRLMPGNGAIDLAALVAAAPEGTASTVEVQNDVSARTTGAAERARTAYQAASALVSR